MKNILDIIPIIANVILSCAAVFGVITYFRTAANNKAKAAMELVCYYVSDIVPTFSFLFACMDKDIFKSICQELDQKQNLYFLRDEMTSIFKYTDLVQRYDNIFQSISFVQVEKEYLTRQFALCYFERFYKEEIASALQAADESAAKLSHQRFESFMKCLTNDMMNKLEYFAMSFLTIGDQRIVYSSIHQTFVNYAKYLYIPISSRNSCYNEYFFANVQKLYNKWNDKENRFERKDKRNREQLYKQYKP